MHHLFELAGTKKAHHHVRLNSEFRSDLQWWTLFMESWNRISMIQGQDMLPPVEMWLDASGSFAFGVISPQLGRWIQLQWPPGSHTANIPRQQSILWKELIPSGLFLLN